MTYTTLFHTGEAPLSTTDAYIGSPMYGVIAEHRLALLLVGLFLLFGWIGRRRLAAAAYGDLDSPHRLAWWLVSASAIAHAGLGLAHEWEFLTAMYWLGAGLLAAASWSLWRQRRHWRLLTGLGLAGSLAAYVVAMIAGEAPDQVGLATKLAELTALAIVLTPRVKRTRLRLVAANGVVVMAFLIVGIAGWLGAFSGSGGHHLGDVPSPGVLLPAGEDRPPTAAEQRAHDDLVAAVWATAERYRDVAVAAADGYDVAHIAGPDYHAANEAYKTDDHYFDPARPENLIYGIGASGEPVLLGVMFEMPGLRAAGPAIGGPLTVWHAHDHVCLSFTGLGPLVSPWGGCPIGHVAIPITNEMIHIWTVPGADEPVGELEDYQRDAYLAQH